MEILILAADSPDDARAKIEAALNKVATILGPPLTKQKRGSVVESKKLGGCAVVIDGDTLRYALEPSLKALFLSLTIQCNAVVCCRVSPAQKALTVKLVKDGCNAMTLSIGDGKPLVFNVLYLFLTRYRCKRRCNDPRGKYRMWIIGFRRITSCHVC